MERNKLTTRKSRNIRTPRINSILMLLRTVLPKLFTGMYLVCSLLWWKVDRANDCLALCTCSGIRIFWVDQSVPLNKYVYVIHGISFSIENWSASCPKVKCGGNIRPTPPLASPLISFDPPCFTQICINFTFEAKQDNINVAFLPFLLYVSF